MRTLEFRESPIGTTVVVDGVEYYNREQIMNIVRGGCDLAAMPLYKPSVSTPKQSKTKPEGYINPVARKLSDADVRRIRANVEGWSQSAWARHFKISLGQINKLVHGKIYKDVI